MSFMTKRKNYPHWRCCPTLSHHLTKGNARGAHENGNPSSCSTSPELPAQDTDCHAMLAVTERLSLRGAKRRGNPPLSLRGTKRSDNPPLSLRGAKRRGNLGNLFILSPINEAQSQKPLRFKLLD